MTDKNIAVITDIFGLCSGLDRLLQDLSGQPVNQAGDATLTITLIDPYQQQRQQFKDEQQAYSAYIDQCGHDNFASNVARALETPVDLVIGFSAGASALWRALSTPAAANIKQAVLFYPGQIYQHLKLTPEVTTTLIFGATEPHFDVDAMVALLQQKPAVSAFKTCYQHGFMNPPSANFNEAGYRDYLGMLQNKLS
ncbi:MAG: hypothetical protein CML20_23355 [Rheinheimera sp.]|uniref:dienelactone hydrolase family protein n=1 Tax=Arsukibacterium sp. UBA3155 TaxID=1946058 RepID=UPI000C956608|nr:dienelactone hydrolase family protein [Arsukibacterium sp. UBA3155]MAD77666.1 hypothetical protein [Rheinheimera sp.]|tara:strand:+ start:33992 stop:34579 length:588 start_codon:yes stop_codon:yes gene_type:complete